MMRCENCYMTFGECCCTWDELLEAYRRKRERRATARRKREAEECEHSWQTRIIHSSR